jgi:hypothetical protein
MTPARTAVQRVEVGAIVRITAPGSRETNGEERVIPAVVTHQWPDGSLQLYAFHFMGSPLLQQAVKPEMVEMVMSRNEFDMIFEDINRRMTELENQIVALGGKRYEPPTRFVMAHDAP